MDRAAAALYDPSASSALLRPGDAAVAAAALALVLLTRMPPLGVGALCAGAAPA